MGAGVDLLVVNGDSNTVGEELRDPERSCWAAVLADELEVPLVNLATRGGSNHRLLRTTVEHLGRIAENHEVAPERVLFVGMWTVLNRFEVMRERPEPLMVPYPGFVDRNWGRIGPWLLESGQERSTVWYRYLQNDVADTSEFFLSSVLLERWLETFGCRFAQTLAYDVLRPKVLDEFCEYVSQMRDDHYVGGVKGWSGQAFHLVVRPLREKGPGGHVLERSHRTYAVDHLLPWLRSVGTVR